MDWKKVGWKDETQEMVERPSTDLEDMRRRQDSKMTTFWVHVKKRLMSLTVAEKSE